MRHGDIWYVTFGPHKADDSAAGMARSTRTFKSEVVYSTIGAIILLLVVRLVRTGGRM